MPTPSMRKGNKVFDIGELVDGGQNIPFVFRKCAINGKVSPLSDGNAEQFETTEEEMEEERPSLELCDSVARLKKQEDQLLAEVQK